MRKSTVGNAMLMQPLFVDATLNNRLGQSVQLQVCHIHHHGRDYVFVVAPNQAANFVSKNAEPFAFQLREYFALDARRFELIEVRNPEAEAQLIRWRFEWVGHSPLSARAEHMISPSQRSTLLGLLGLDDIAAVANG
jgi:hypothetical protein